MAVKWNKIYRGGVHRTVPETREAKAPASGTLLPGQAVTITANTATLGAIGDKFWYVVGEQLHGTVDENQVGLKSSARLYTPRSGDLMAGRIVAGVAIVDDLPLTINATGQFAAATLGTDKVYAYVDDPNNAYTRTTTPTTANQLVPIKIA